MFISLTHGVIVFESLVRHHMLPSDLDLAAFPPLSRNESIASRRLRAEAYTSTSRILKDKYTVSAYLACVKGMETLHMTSLFVYHSALPDVFRPNLGHHGRSKVKTDSQS